ncbi:MAG: dephospho-CoA kinase [Chitinophagales bacterium]|nr:dephospho-CoA kinase [Bacteroidota bacterium]MCB9043009.1 dephospho-CoA kinase [Chitinophagales bacterium]
MQKIGITGGIGSGKSIVCKLFALLEIPIYYADARAKYLMQEDKTVKKQLIETFGREIFSPNDTLNRQLLAQKVFNNPLELQKLNNIVHPAVKRDSEQWFAHLPKNTPYALKEAALIFEAKIENQFDKIIVVTAPQKLRIARVQQRDNLSIAQIKARMRQQLSEKYKIQQADFVIYNNEKKALIPQVMALHQELLGF